MSLMSAGAVAALAAACSAQDSNMALRASNCWNLDGGCKNPASQQTSKPVETASARVETVLAVSKAAEPPRPVAVKQKPAAAPKAGSCPSGSISGSVLEAKHGEMVGRIVWKKIPSNQKTVQLDSGENAPRSDHQMHMEMRIRSEYVGVLGTTWCYNPKEHSLYFLRLPPPGNEVTLSIGYVTTESLSRQFSNHPAE